MIGLDLWAVVAVATMLVLAFVWVAHRFIRRAEEQERQVEREQASRQRSNPAARKEPQGGEHSG